jgi:hypothetical protein
MPSIGLGKITMEKCPRLDVLERPVYRFLCRAQYLMNDFPLPLPGLTIWQEDQSSAAGCYLASHWQILSRNIKSASLVEKLAHNSM